MVAELRAKQNADDAAKLHSLRRLTWLTTLGLLGAAVIGWVVSPHGWLRWAHALASAAVIGLLVWANASRKLGTNSRAWLVTLALFGAGGSTLVIAGFSPFGTTVLVVSIVLASAFVGERSGWLMLLAMLTLYGALSLLVPGGWLSAPAPLALDVLNPHHWLRVGLLQSALGGLLALGVGSLVRRLDGEVRARSQAVEQLQSEQARRSHAVAAQLDAERALAESQRLEAVGRLAGGIAHDFNNALMAILSWADAMRQQDQSPAVREAADAITIAGRNAAQLTRSLLAIGRRQVGSPVPVDLAEAVDDHARTLRRLLPENIEVRAEADPVPAVLFDRGQLDQMLLNLATNAADAMPEGGLLTLKVGPATSTSPGKPWVELTVEDNGFGIDEETRRHVFEPFFTTKHDAQGTGLGLPSVLGIVEGNGGTLELDTEVGRGTRFIIRLPATDRPASRHVLAPSNSRIPLAHGQRILLVEDEPLVRAAMRRSLRRAGFEVECASDPSAALQALAMSGEFDLLVTDAGLPGVGCQPVIDSFVDRYPGRPVLVCSGHVEDELLRRGLELKRWSFLQKPVPADELVDTIRKLLARSVVPASEPAQVRMGHD